MSESIISELIHRCFSAWENGDEKELDILLADEFTFSSPNGDDHINKGEYWKKCWVNQGMIKNFHILNLIEGENEAFVRYECQLVNGKIFRNTEYFRIKDNQIIEVDVYFCRILKNDSTLDYK